MRSHNTTSADALGSNAPGKRHTQMQSTQSTLSLKGHKMDIENSNVNELEMFSGDAVLYTFHAFLSYWPTKLLRHTSKNAKKMN